MMRLKIFCVLIDAEPVNDYKSTELEHIFINGLINGFAKYSTNSRSYISYARDVLSRSTNYACYIVEVCIDAKIGIDNAFTSFKLFSGMCASVEVQMHDNKLYYYVSGDDFYTAGTKTMYVSYRTNNTTQFNHVKAGKRVAHITYDNRRGKITKFKTIKNVAKL